MCTVDLSAIKDFTMYDFSNTIVIADNSNGVLPKCAVKQDSITYFLKTSSYAFGHGF